MLAPPRNPDFGWERPIVWAAVHGMFIIFRRISLDLTGFESDFTIFYGISWDLSGILICLIRQTFFRAQRRGSGSSSARYGATPKHRFPHGEEPVDDFGLPEKLRKHPTCAKNQEDQAD